jgi:maleylpyruvate isomerase
MRLHGYLRSAATWRVRIALALKNLDVVLVPHVQPTDGSRPKSLLHLNPQGLAPVLETDDGLHLTQSMAILEWLDEMWPSPPLLPPQPVQRARVRAFAQAIISDINPLLSDRSLARLGQLGLGHQAVRFWTRQTLSEGLDACETLLSGSEQGPFCFGAAPGLADLCLVPQLDQARRLGLMLTFPRLLAAEAACMTLPAFQASMPPDPWSDLP